jgi:hypothetical protein
MERGMSAVREILLKDLIPSIEQEKDPILLEKTKQEKNLTAHTSQIIKHPLFWETS